MSSAAAKAKFIVEYVNQQLEELDNNERVMVMLFIAKLMESAVELDIVDTLRGNGRDS